jgi:hypothetical protein
MKYDIEKHNRFGYSLENRGVMPGHSGEEDATWIRDMIDLVFYSYIRFRVEVNAVRITTQKDKYLIEVMLVCFRYHGMRLVDKRITNRKIGPAEVNGSESPDLRFGKHFKYRVSSRKLTYIFAVVYVVISFCQYISPFTQPFV